MVTIHDIGTEKHHPIQSNPTISDDLSTAGTCTPRHNFKNGTDLS